jgi:hypothetical protein
MTSDQRFDEAHLMWVRLWSGMKRRLYLMKQIEHPPSTSGDIGVPPFITSLGLSNNRAGGMLFKRCPRAPAHSASKMRLSSA